MKTTWVLTEQERKEKFEGRRKKKSGSPGEEAVDNPGLVNRVNISREELEQVGGLGLVGGSWWGSLSCFCESLGLLMHLMMNLVILY